MALFIIAKIWKQLKCPLIDEWVKKMWYTYTMEYYSTIKKNMILPFVECRKQNKGTNKKRNKLRGTDNNLIFSKLGGGGQEKGWKGEKD